MLSIKPISNGGAYRFYLERESAGEWIGTGAKILGLPQQVSAEEFRAIRQGLDPDTGEPLRIRRVVDREYRKPWGLQTYRAREMYDLTMSPAKSVSVLGLVDPNVKQAHREAVAGTMKEMERVCGAMVVAKYEHGYSRKLDMQIHSHLLAGNLAHDGERWRTMHANELYRRQYAITEDYRARLNAMLERWGYRIDYPEVAGVSPEIIQRFSQQKNQIQTMAQKHAQELGIRPEEITNRERAVIANREREPKRKISEDELRQLQLSRLTPSERDTLIRVRDEALERAGKHRHSLREDGRYEKPLQRQDWDYGESFRPRMRV